jgi:hypothetical protein
MSDDAADCRKRAQEAAGIAEKMTGPLDKAVWLKVASEWLKLAETAEAQRKSKGLAVMRNPPDLPPAITPAFIKDMQAYFTEEDGLKRDVIAVRQLNTLKELQGPHEKKLRLSDVKEMFEQMKNQATLAGPSRRGH